MAEAEVHSQTSAENNKKPVVKLPSSKHAKETETYFVKTCGLEKPQSKAIAKAVLSNSNEFNRGALLEKIGNSIKEIRASLGGAAGWVFEETLDETGAVLFTRSPQTFVNLAKRAEKRAEISAENKFYAVSHAANATDADKSEERKRDILEDKKYKEADRFIEVANALCNPRVFGLFMENPEKFEEMATAGGNGSKIAFEALSDEKIAKLFERSPSAFADMVRDAGHALGNEAYDPKNIFQWLSNDAVWGLFMKNPEAFAEMAKATSSSFIDVLRDLSYPEVALLFEHNTDSFVQIAKSCKEHADAVFLQLCGKSLSGLFARNPDALVQVICFAGTGAYRALYSLDDTRLVELFLNNSDAFVQIAKAAGEKTGEAFAELAKERVEALFSKNADAFVRIAQATGERAAEAFGAFAPVYVNEKGKTVDDPNDKLARMLEKNAGLFVQLAEAAGSGTGGMFASLYDEKVAKLFLKKPQQFIGFINAAKEQMPANEVLTGLLKSSKSQINNTLDSPQDYLAKCKYLYEEFGVEFFGRFNYDIIENAYKTATDPEFSNGRKIALILQTKNDYVGVPFAPGILKHIVPKSILEKHKGKSFMYRTKIYEDLVKRGYAIVLCEAGYDNEFAERMFNQGMRDGGKSAVSGRKYDLALIGGHGTRWRINFGWNPYNLYLEDQDVDVSDFNQNPRFSKGSWNNLFEDAAACILVSCSTNSQTQKETGINNPGNFKNIKEMFEALAENVHFHAPEEISAFIGLKFDSGNDVVGARFIHNPDSSSSRTKELQEKQE